MKIVLVGSKESLALFLKDFFKERGHQVLILHRNPQGEEEASLEEMNKGALEGVDAVINFPEKYLISGKKTENYKKEFMETHIKHSEMLKSAIENCQTPPKVLITASSVSYYPKAEERFYKESEELGDDEASKLIKHWEDVSRLKEGCSVRTIVMRMGLVLSPKIGLLKELIPIFRLGLGSVMGDGTEALPWIYIKDLFWLILYFIENEDASGVYNTVAPQLINTKKFSEALSTVMHKRLWFKLPRKFFEKRLGDAAEIVFARSKVYPSRILKSGFGYRYPAIYPALVDAFSGRG